MANLERVRAVVAHIEKSLAKQDIDTTKNLLHFNMEDWYRETKNLAGDVCGTSMCLAGWSAHYAGLKMYEWEDPEYGDKEIVVGVDGRPNVETWAEGFLGFTPDETEVFYQTDIDNLEALKSALNYFLDTPVFEEVEDYYPV